ncbi:mosc domain containing protein [Sporothrix brasiliensis 5110]|uniref:Mosc domain containing protein n=1 Tax=Sporothrix brasiliensis 5110 TaxID=1398154 RepID=A0A0C2FML8_9PEZI|nr:mosc domain containing protein [Sporothrix brasiliensis 5110]KIH92318.1 mosc domain containing protein [Sporothrix brasiliensis 5110]
MKVREIYVYPVKSLGGIALPAAELDAQGIRYDRRFMLMTTKRSKTGALHKMQLSSFPECALFSQEFAGGDSQKKKGNSIKSKTKASGDVGDAVIVHYHPPESKPSSTSVDRAGAEKNRIIMSPVQHPPLRIPLNPSIRTLRSLDVNLHGSPARGYRMGDPYDAWFSACFGFDVVLVYIGDGRRKVLGETLKTGVKVRNRKREPNAATTTPTTPWTAFLSFVVSAWLSLLAVLGIRKKAPPEQDEPWLTFSDCAPFLVTSQSSLRSVRARMSEGVDVPMYKFRPNIVVDGDGEAEWAEDYWGELTVRPLSKMDPTASSVSEVPSLTASSSPSSRGSSPAELDGAEDGASGPVGAGSGPVRLVLTSNCTRCTSLNVDYKTGARAAGELGEVLGRLAKDRRVDRGNKYSPVFGRYAFLDPQGGDSGGEGDDKDEDIVRIAVGDEVAVTRRNAERTVWDWPDL